MPTETELNDQLEEYGRWLESELETVLHHPGSGLIEAPLIEDAPIVAVEEVVERSRSGGLVAALAALVVLVVGVAWLGQDQDRSPDEIAVEQTGPADETEAPVRTTPVAEAPAPLLVLPESLDGFRSNGFSIDDATSSENDAGIIVGRTRPGGYSDVSVVLLSAETRAPLSGTEADMISIAGRNVAVPNHDPLDPNPGIHVEVEAGVWVDILPASVELRQALIEATSVVDGAIQFDSVNDLQVLERIDQPGESATGFMSLRGAPESADYVTIVVRSTAEDSTYMFPFAGVGEMEAVTVRGNEGFLVERNSPLSPDGVGLAWVEQPGQIITLYVSANLDVFDIAEGLRIVDEDTWDSELSELDKVDFDENMSGVRIFPFSMIDENGAEVEIAPDGSFTVLIAGQPSCAECVANLEAIQTLRTELDAAVRFIAVPLDDNSTWGQSPEWGGATWTLRNDATNNLRTPLETRGILVLDGENRTVMSIPIASPLAIDQLRFVLDNLS